MERTRSEVGPVEIVKVSKVVCIRERRNVGRKKDLMHTLSHSSAKGIGHMSVPVLRFRGQTTRPNMKHFAGRSSRKRKQRGSCRDKCVYRRLRRDVAYGDVDCEGVPFDLVCKTSQPLSFD